MLPAALSAQSASEFAGAEACLTCHNGLEEQDSVHLASLASPSAEGHRGLPMGSAATFRCEACHGASAAHAERQQGGPWVLPPNGFGDANTNSENNTACLECHGAKMPDLDAHAQLFHATAKKNELGCMRCHGGVSHGLPDWVVDLRAAQEAFEP